LVIFFIFIIKRPKMFSLLSIFGTKSLISCVEHKKKIVVTIWSTLTLHLALHVLRKLYISSPFNLTTFSCIYIRRKETNNSRLQQKEVYTRCVHRAYTFLFCNVFNCKRRARKCVGVHCTYISSNIHYLLMWWSDHAYQHNDRRIQ